MFKHYKKLEPEDIPAFKKTVHQMYINASELKLFAERLAPMVQLLLPESTPDRLGSMVQLLLSESTPKAVTKVVTKGMSFIFVFTYYQNISLLVLFFFFSLVKNVLRIQRGKKS